MGRVQLLTPPPRRSRRHSTTRPTPTISLKSRNRPRLPPRQESPGTIWRIPSPTIRSDHSTVSDCSRRSCRGWNRRRQSRADPRRGTPERRIVEARAVVINVGARDPFAPLPAIGLQGKALHHRQPPPETVIVVAVEDGGAGVGDQADRAFAIRMIVELRSRPRRRRRALRIDFRRQRLADRPAAHGHSAPIGRRRRDAAAPRTTSGPS